MVGFASNPQPSAGRTPLVLTDNAGECRAVACRVEGIDGTTVSAFDAGDHPRVVCQVADTGEVLLTVLNGDGKPRYSLGLIDGFPAILKSFNEAGEEV